MMSVDRNEAIDRRLRVEGNPASLDDPVTESRVKQVVNRAERSRSRVSHADPSAVTGSYGKTRHAAGSRDQATDPVDFVPADPGRTMEQRRIVGDSGVGDDG